MTKTTLKCVIGDTFVNLTVQSRAGVYSGGTKNANWWCKCVCGNGVVVSSNNLRSGNTKSCGCSRKRKSAHARRGIDPRTYRSWASMIQRCTNPNNTWYHRYGGRGIYVDPTWRDYTKFLDDMGARPAGKTLDRLDNDLGYCKDNCRWATPLEQTRNRG